MTRSLRILVATNMYPPHHLGGYELSCQDVVEGLRARGHDVLVLTGDVRRPDVEGAADPPWVRRDLRLYWRDHVVLRPGLRASLAVEHHDRQVLRHAIEETAPDVVSFWNLAALPMSLVQVADGSGIPALLAVCNDWLVFGPDLDGWQRWIRRRPVRWLADRLAPRRDLSTRPAQPGSTGSICFVSRSTQEWAERHTGRQFPDATVIYSGIAEQDFPVPDAPPAPRTWRWRLLYAGRIAPEKGVSTAVRALAACPPEATLRLVGPADPDELERLWHLAEELGVAGRVQHVECSRPAMRAEYESADAALFPSVWNEPFGLVAVEAMACGTPVVGTGSGGTAEFLVDGVTGLTFPPGDSQRLAEALGRLAADVPLRTRLVENGATVARQLTSAALVEHFEAWHVAVADRFRAGRPAARPSPLLALERRA